MAEETYRTPRSSTYFQRIRFLALRAESVNEAEAVDKLLKEFPDFKRGTSDWERDFTRSKMTPMDIVRADAKPDDVLRTLVDEEARARMVMDAAADAVNHDYKDPDKLNAWQKSYRAWNDISKRVQQQAEVVRRFELEVKDAERWKAEWKELVDGLREEYVGKGPQYELLIESVADIMIRMRRLRESERDIKSTEAYNWHAMLNNSIKSLQRYTESTKQEIAHKAVNAAIADVLKIIENEARSRAPEVWESVVVNIREYARKKNRAA